ncbi:MAG: response regulator [Ignavibacteriaceae bacterium]|nr:response regulator [Ignavibacteriaceae bacterium]
MVTTLFKFLQGLHKLKEISRKFPSEFSDNLCEFLVEELDIYSSVLFRIEDEKLIVLGKSANSRKSFEKSQSYKCAKCKLVTGAMTPGKHYYSDDNCDLKSSNFLLHEICLLIDDGAEKRYLLKLTQNTPFTSIDSENLNLLSYFLSDYFRSTFPGAKSSGINFADVISDLAGELRTPVNSISGFGSLLLNDNLNDFQTEYVKSIKDNAQKLQLLVSDLIELSKIDSGSVELGEHHVNLTATLEEVIKNFTDKPDTVLFTAEFVISQSAANSVSIDSRKLRMILVNILTLFVAEKTDGTVKIEVNPVSEAGLQFILRAPSLSIPPQRLNNILRVYINQDKKAVSHSPLLMNIVKRYVEMLEGSVEISSNPIQGTEVKFTVKHQSVSAIEQTIAALPKPEAKNKVLVIEDDYATSKLLSNYLTKWGYDPKIVNSGVKALEDLEQGDYLAVITNLILPDINGLELLKKIRENNKTKHTPVIACSVEADQQKAFLMGAVEYFVKPISYKDLVEVLTSYKLKKNSNVLCVDDDINMLNLVKDAIQSVGFNPVYENDSTKVIERINGMDLDLAIIDLDMPGMNGFELIKAIKSEAQFANLPIVIYTGKENFDEDLAKIDGLFSELLSKRSTKIEELAQTISQMVNRYEEPTKPSEMVKAEESDAAKILLVEDYKHSQIIVTRLLKKNGFNFVNVVENGQEAVDSAQKMQYDLILMDMQMPVMNGFEATERIRQMLNYKDTPIIALTAFAMKGDKEKCIEAGATDYIPKPIDSHDFIEKVKFYTKKL